MATLLNIALGMLACYVVFLGCVQCHMPKWISVSVGVIMAVIIYFADFGSAIIDVLRELFDSF